MMELMGDAQLRFDRWRQIERLFLAALEHPKAERGAFLDAACGADKALRAGVLELLRADEEAGEFLERPLVQPPRPSPTEADQRPGVAVGPYRLLRKIGEGGMSAVFLAARSDDVYEKQVAVKLFRLGPEWPDLLARFRAERQILASLDHPCIAKLLDGGSTARGTPYFVMEYVDGLPIDAYCDRERLSVEARLELFRKVCAAVQCAHASLIVHRDIKPSNILVRPDGEPKLLDFGIAKLLDPEGLAVEVDRTHTGQRLMTPAYASPEQVRGEPITTAADVWALGVLLFELLTGRRPHDLENRTLPEALRLITEEDPGPPSLAVNAPAAGVPDTTLAAHYAARGMTRDQLRRRLQGDLDNIVLKAIRREPARRYGSVEQLAEDVRRHLVGLPVMARPDTLGYRAGKFVRRHRLGVGFGAVFALVVLGFGTVTLVQSRRLAGALSQAQREAAKARAASRFLRETVGAANPFGGVGREVTVLEVLRRKGATLGESFADQPETAATIRATLGATYLDLGRLEEAEPLLEEALSTRKKVLGRHPEVAESLLDLGKLLTVKGDFTSAEALLREALALQQELFGAEALETSEALYRRGQLFLAKGDYGEAEDLLRRCLGIRRRLLSATDLRLARCVRGLGWVLLRKADYAGAEAFFREDLSIARRSSPPGGAETAVALHGLASVLLMKGDLAGAEPLFRESLSIRRALLGGEHTAVADSLGNLAIVRAERGFLDEAIDLDREALAIFKKVLGEQSQEVASMSKNLAADLGRAGRLREARELLETTLALHRRIWKDGKHEDIADDLDNLGHVLLLEGRLGEAETHFRRGLEISRAVLGADHPSTANTLSHLASTLHRKGDRDAALALYEEALQILSSKLPPDHVHLARCRFDLGGLLIELRRYPEAREQLVAAYRSFARALGRDSEETTGAADALRRLSRAWKDPRAAAEIRALLGSGD
jgi:serine/threonine-protein kinase